MRISASALPLVALFGWMIASHGRCPAEGGRENHPYVDRGDGCCSTCGVQRCAFCAHMCACSTHDGKSRHRPS